MTITLKHDNTEAFCVANSLAQERGYADYASIDDPALREWIWNRAHPFVRVHHNLVISPLALATPALIIFVIGILLGLSL